MCIIHINSIFQCPQQIISHRLKYTYLGGHNLLVIYHLSGYFCQRSNWEACLCGPWPWPAWSNCVFSFLLLILERKVPELSKFSGRNLLLLQKTQVLYFILNNTIRFLYFIFVQQWACHLKRFCCSVHYSSHSNVDAILFFLQNYGNISSKTHILRKNCKWTHCSKDNIFHTMTNWLVWSTGLNSAPVSCSSTDSKRKFPAALPWLNGLWYSLCLGTWLVECSVFTILCGQTARWSNKHAVRNFQMLLLLWNSKLTFQQLHHLLLLFFTSTST